MAHKPQTNFEYWRKLLKIGSETGLIGDDEYEKLDEALSQEENGSGEGSYRPLLDMTPSGADGRWVSYDLIRKIEKFLDDGTGIEYDS
jgi:hypothetical protein